MILNIKKAISSVALGIFCVTSMLFAKAADDQLALPRASNLQDDAKEAKARKIPIVLFANLTGCHYCRGALREVLMPMQRDAGWTKTAIFRQIDVDKSSPLTDFTGKKTTHEAFASAMKLNFTPTVLVVDDNAKPMAEPIVGVANWDFYGYNVESAIRQGFERAQAVK